MSAILQWSLEALEDFSQQISYISDDNPEAALNIARRVDECAEKLALRSTGRPGRVSGTLEKPVPGLPYIIAYVISANAGGSVLTILRLIHTARDWRKGTWPKDN